jgi:tartrate dehydratase beta subunit/fumarate hydratase class I family protein
MIKLFFPFTEEKIRALKVGDEVLISGIVFAGRGAALRGAYFEIKSRA